MTTNKTEIRAFLMQQDGYEPYVSIRRDSNCSGVTHPLIRLSDYEALQAECEKLRKEAERYKEALTRISIQVDGNVRECVRDCVNGQPDVQDIYDYCDEIDSIIDAAMEPTK